MSLDGYIAGPNDGPGNPLGDGGEPLFEWMHTDPDAYGSRGLGDRVRRRHPPALPGRQV